MIDLGYYTFLLPSKDVEGTAAFYERMGFRSTGFYIPNTNKTVVQGRNQLGFLDFYDHPGVNFRGPDIPKLATRLSLDGFRIQSDLLTWDYQQGAFRVSNLDSDHPEASQCGSFIIFDPHGFDLFFNTNPGERGPYERTKTNPLFSGEEGWPPNITVETVPVTVPLGDLVILMEVPEAEPSIDFYKDLGFTIAEEAGDWTRLSYIFDGDKRGPDYLLRESAQKSLRPAFLCQDIDLVTGELTTRGIDWVVNGDETYFEDPDGRKIALLTVEDI